MESIEVEYRPKTKRKWYCKRMSKGRLSLICCIIIVAFTAITLAILFGMKYGECMVGNCSEDVQVDANSSKGFRYAHAAVAADSGICSEVGRDMLQKGGNAIDATVAALLCNSIINPHSHGIGGGHFMMVYLAEKGRAVAIDAREEAPGAATQNMFSDNDDEDAATKGGLSIAVPGELDGFWLAHLHYGKLPWKDLFQPAIKLAEDGVAVGPALAKAIKDKEDVILEESSLREVFAGEDGNILQEGDLMTRPKYAETLRKIAAGSSDTFYLGRLAYDIVADIQDRDGILSVEDLRNYRAKLKEPIKVDFGDYTLYTVPPPSSGPVLAMILNMLEGFNFGPLNVSSTEAAAQTYHRVAETFKFAYARRSELGDEDFMDLKKIVNEMISEEFAINQLQQIDDKQTHDINFYGGSFYSPEDAGTTHLSVIDEEGNAVSTTSSVNLYFGSKVRGTRTGIIFNDEMDDFSSPNIVNYFGLPPSEANFIQPGKRPLSSMSPVIVVDNKTNKVKLAVGAAGGTKIISATALIALNSLWLQEDIKTAIDKPRIHHQLSPNKLQYEDGFDEDILEELNEKYGHELKEQSGMSVVMAVLRQDDGLYAYSDERKAGGYPAGY
ncbi:glutathione hydrolase 1 proenzyme-like isoform X2 [Ptychodera flava]|uniref:glutathione hydrolase 1 proenzyme-like isoform X2 n=1 Tax=Ptychodera flava TaxID=63121 RepID=UPI00396A6085